MSRTIVFCLSFSVLVLSQAVASSIDEGLKELSKLSKALQDPMLDDKQIGSMIRVDKIPVDEALKDLSAVVKLMVVEHQLTLQSLRVISIALEKLSKKVRSQQHPNKSGNSGDDMSVGSGETAAAMRSEDMKHEITKRSVFGRFRRQAAEVEEDPTLNTNPSNRDSDNTPKSRQKRWFLGGLGLLGLSSLYSPWGWGGYGYGYGYPYYGSNGYYYPYTTGYYYPSYYYPNYYYPYYPMMRAPTTAPAAALRKAAKKSALSKSNVTKETLSKSAVRATSKISSISKVSNPSS